MGSRSFDGSSAGVGTDRRDHLPQTGKSGLAAVLNRALQSAVHRLNAATAVVYLLDEDGTQLRTAMIGGSPPSAYTLPGRMPLDASYASARALASGNVEVLADPDLIEVDNSDGAPYPYVAISAPLTAPGHRFGAITVLRLETYGGCAQADAEAMRDIADELALDLAALAEEGVAVTPGHMPVLVPAFSAHAENRTPGWGIPDVPGSAGMSLVYPMRRLADMLNRATTMDHIVRAARFCVMIPFRAQALALVSAREGRLWVLGHTGDSSDIARNLHGAVLDDSTPAAKSVRDRPVFISHPSADESQTEAYLPLLGSRHATDLLPAEGADVVGLCCLTFERTRDFPPEERAILNMMAGSLGAAVERVELGRQQRAAAETLQRQLLPPTLSELARLTTAARYRPAVVTSEAGGDWYDVIMLSDDRVVLVVGDVEGHSMESAAVMGQVRSALVAYVTEGHRPAAVIDRTGRCLTAMGAGLLVTCCVVALDTVAGMAEVALAGHPEPLVLLPDGSTDTLHAPANVPLGVTAEAGYLGREHTLVPESILMLYSDGLLDWSAADPMAGARALLGSGDPAALPDLEELADHLIADTTGPQYRRDDAVLLLARCEHVDGEVVPRTDSLRIQRRDLRGVKTARDFVDDRMRAWGLTEMADGLQLVVSEIVTNALVHAGSDVELRLRVFAERVRIEVRDSASNPPVPSPLSLSEEGLSQAEHGRGLFIVDALTEGWKSFPNGRGKTVSLDVLIPDS
ncbi:SpoIIE family protein phosphatase [Streptomyces sp. NBC_01341]|uniref:SpoIIE family protein phosphatase n=1 Tax=Streptomyces sp. NBC_01341 TaxID=2903831 RepID=UPI002E10D9B7|nr:SpoIIE family protein phosphatase [Streptomyces sp. NBC_01341]